MSLHMESIGQGPDLVMLHGWGLNAGVWGEAAEALAENYRLHLVDLPGHGRSSLDAPFTLQNAIQQVSEHLPEKAILLGWSLGGMIATGVALRHPERVQKLILVASNAQFVQSDNWTTAMQPAVLAGFAGSLQKDYQATVQRFLLLQAKGGDNAKETVRLLRQRLAEQGEADPQALADGLEILRTASWLVYLSELQLPTLMLNGRLDALVPKGAGEAMLAHLPQGQLKVFEHAAHAPFVSHPAEFVAAVRQFIEAEV